MYLPAMYISLQMHDELFLQIVKTVFQTLSLYLYMYK
jgi:hypothetical protein